MRLADGFRAVVAASGRFEYGVEVRERGSVERVGSGVARASGLPSVGFEELVRFEGGELGIVRLRNRYFVVTPEGAAAVRERAPEYLVVLNQGGSDADDAAYAEHPIPDDLTW